MFLEGLSIFRELGDTRATGWSLCLLGQVAWSLGDYMGADRFLEESLSYYRQSGDGLGEAWVLDWTANVRVDEGRLEEAEKLFRQGHDSAGGEKADDTPRAWHHYHLGILHLAKGDRTQGRAEMEKARVLFTKLGDPNGLDNTCIHLARLYCQEGQPGKALPLLKDSLETALSSGLVPVLVEALTVLAQYEKADGKDNQALALLLMALHHPACRQATKDGSEEFYREMQSKFPADEVAGALRWAKGSRLEVVVADWLGSHAAVAGLGSKRKTVKKKGEGPKKMVKKAKKKKGKK
jgi:tetratricopeptide (TPR) repeat protein